MRKKPVVAIELLLVITGLVFVVSSLFLESRAAEETTAKDKTFSSNGERIYFTGLSGSGAKITSTGGPTSSDWLLVDGRFACVSCHGPSGEGVLHNLGPEQYIFAKAIRWSALQSNYDAEKFKTAVVKGLYPNGDELQREMPHWTMSDDDLADLIAFLKTLP